MGFSSFIVGDMALLVFLKKNLTVPAEIHVPTLREVWRTAPYLFDGRAATMEEVFEIHKHGIDKKVSKKEIKALTEYVNSL